jgi:elongation factor P hydroxylase
VQGFPGSNVIAAPPHQIRASASLPTAGAICQIFETALGLEFHTELTGGSDEPLYSPSTATAPARISFRHDYVSSALHEVAHWCIAGAERRAMQDYGYWYAPDGRCARQQQRFVGVEARPQALEWLFSLACGVHFRLSVDNLDAPRDKAGERALANAVAQQALALRATGLPPRAARFFDALRGEFNPSLCLDDFDLGVRSLQ